MKNIKTPIYLCLLIAIAAIASCSQQDKKTKEQANAAPVHGAIDINTVLQPINSSVISSVATTIPQEKEMPVQIKADGYLDFDTRTFNNIAARYSGRIEKLYVKYAFQMIYHGERIFDIYSPEIVTAQQDLIYVTEHSAQETGLINSATQKLLLLGLTPSQISQVKTIHKPFYALPVFSPYEGHIHDMQHSQSPGDKTMATEQENYTGNNSLSIKEGMYVDKGQTIFNVVNPHKLWAVIKIQNEDIANLKLHQPVIISSPDIPGMLIKGQVNFIEPILQQGDKFTSIRVYIENANHALMVNSVVKAVINTGSKNGLWIPRSSLINLGQNKVVWLKTEKVFKVRQVQGVLVGDSFLVTKGLSARDSIAKEAQYLTDSESFIQLENYEQ